MKQNVRLFQLFFLLLLFSCGPGKERIVVLHTTLGNIQLRLFNNTPVYRDNFIRFAENTKGDTVLFYRILRDQLIQFGQGNNRNMVLEPAIKSPLRSGVLAAALTNEQGAQSDGTNFFIVQGRPQNDSTLNAIEQKLAIKFSDADRKVYKKYGGLPQWQGKYTVFGQVMEGMEVVDRIAALPRDAEDRPLEDVSVHIEIK